MEWTRSQVEGRALPQVSVSPRQAVYRHGGLRVASEIALPWSEDPQPAGTIDVSIRLGSVRPISYHGPSPIALSFEDGDFRLSVAGVGRYLVHGGRDVVLDPERAAPPEDVRLYLAGAVFGAVWHQRGILSLHATAVLLDGACLLFAGRSGAGKSTLAAHLVRAGFPLVTDDVCVLSEQGPDNGVSVWPSTSSLKLATDSLQALGGGPLEAPERGRHARETAARRSWGQWPRPGPDSRATTLPSRLARWPAAH